ncbi:glycosyltransferase family 2 protein, partial [Aquimarina agarilytica]|uniref:glycosyltransferase family 2 protein n=1 Tax=Aquimarina agarilytica TaxID=1087449 RepID=UPI00030B23FB
MTPFFSVIIPLYNKEDFIKTTLDSALKQNFIDYEIIIINDGSTDNSLSVVEKINDKKIKIYSQKNSGVSTARNNGIKFANGKYIAFLDADDYWFPNHLSELNRAISAYPEYKIFCNNYKVETKKNTYKENRFSYLPKPEFEDLYIIQNYFKSSLIADIAWTSAVCIEKKLILDNDFFFDPDIISIQDIDLWTRLGIKHSFIFNKRETTIYALFVFDSLSDSKNIDNKALLISKNKNSEGNTPYLKSYLDQNRFAIANQYKILGKKRKFKEFKSQINLSNLSFKRLVLLHLPHWLIKLLLNFR